jgi:hypothetical protein
MTLERKKSLAVRKSLVIVLPFRSDIEMYNIKLFLLWFFTFMSTNAHHCAGSSPVEETGHHYPNGGHHIQPRIFHPTHPVQAFHEGKIFYFNIREALLTLSVFDQRCFIGSRTFPN